VLAVVDSFSVALLREVWRSQEPVPQFNVAAITTGDPQAIRAYLQGERFYRASSWDSAEVAFGRAVEADSTFALAHYRLVRIAGWSGGRHVAQREAELAHRYAERLPARERTLVLAEYLRFNRRDAEALDTLRAYLERYPDDPEALFTVVDRAYHEWLEEGSIDQALRPAAEQVRPFDRIIRLDPTFTPALIHPLERSLAAGDSALFGRYIALLAAAVPAETLAIRTYRTAFRALRQPEDTGTLLQALALTLRRDQAEDLKWQARLAALDPLTRALIGLPAEKRRPVVNWLLSELEGKAASERHAGMALQVLIAAGLLEEAGDLLVKPSVRSAMSASGYRSFGQMPSDLGYVDGEVHDGVFAQNRSRDELLRSRLLAALDRADGEAIRRIAVEAREHGQAVGAPIWETLAHAAGGFVAALDGDAASGLARVEDVLGMNNQQTGPFWFRWAEWLGRYPGTRARGIALLSVPWDAAGTYWPGSGAYDVPRLFALGRALEADGELAGAREAYGRFVAILAEADPGLLVHEKVDSARAALARLP
jgi:tetratricopeptide (TPR) repeat protein